MIIAQTVSPQNIVSSYNPIENKQILSEAKRILVNGIQYTFSSIQSYSSEMESKLYKVDTRNFLENMELHTDYPEISDFAKCFANQICKDVFDYKNLNPSRTANSVEGGIAIVYSRKKGFFKKDYKELFIECYNDNTAVISLSENYKLKKINEVSIEDTQIVLNYIAEMYKS